MSAAGHPRCSLVGSAHGRRSLTARFCPAPARGRSDGDGLDLEKRVGDPPKKPGVLGVWVLETDDRRLLGVSPAPQAGEPVVGEGRWAAVGGKRMSRHGQSGLEGPMGWDSLAGDGGAVLEGARAGSGATAVPGRTVAAICVRGARGASHPWRTAKGRAMTRRPAGWRAAMGGDPWVGQGVGTTGQDGVMADGPRVARKFENHKRQGGGHE